MGWLWHVFGQVVARPYFGVIEDWPLARFFYLRDSGPIDDVMRFEYENHRKARAARLKLKN